MKNQGNWTFSSTYQGCLKSREEGDKRLKFEEAPANHQIDYSRLRDRTNPIAVSEDIVLYEDELDDNGQSQVRLRFRLMKDCFFLLLRCYVRIDQVLIRLIETRIFCLRVFRGELASNKRHRYTTPKPLESRECLGSGTTSSDRRTCRSAEHRRPACSFISFQDKTAENFCHSFQNTGIVAEMLSCFFTLERGR